MSNPDLSYKKQALLKFEVANIQAYLDSVGPLPGGGPGYARWKNELIIIQNLPLPRWCRPDHIDVLLVIDRFPETPPIGIYVLSKSKQNEKLIEQMKKIFNAFPNQAHHNAEPFPGYTWICFAYRDNRWRYRADDPLRGDNIAKFLRCFYAELNR